MRRIEERKKKGLGSDDESNFSDNKSINKNGMMDDDDSERDNDNSSDEDANIYYKEEKITKEEMGKMQNTIKNLRIELLDLLEKGKRFLII